jgi:hypothetical protein
MVQGERRSGNELGRLPYLKPGTTYASIKVRIKGVDSGKTYGELSDRSGLNSGTSAEGPTFVVLGVGYNLNGFRLPTNERGEDDNNQAQSFRMELRGGWVETAQLIDVGMLPDHWFGYGAVDVMVLGTGANREFWEALGQPQHEKRRKAIAEWVRRGGRVILSVGTNLDALDALKELKEMLPANIPPGGKKTVDQLSYNWWQARGSISKPNGVLKYRDGKTDFPVVTLQPRPDRATRTILSEDDKGTKPIAIQGPYGLGRVTVVAFDLDRAPLNEWIDRAAFWENMLNQAGYVLPTTGSKLEKYGTKNDEYSAALQGSLDFFEGVPVVSFGWVALFILIYIVLIGPVDYLFLKKVVKRLEWTWVTFPIIVITVSAGAYFAAYALKGRDLKINKVDLVDIDLAGKRMDGNTWFTLFSPRIQNYTIGVEPAGTVSGGDTSAPSWTPAVAKDAARDTVISWQGAVERRGYGNSGSSFLSKRYSYQSIVDPQDPNRDLYAAGLDGVPIQVWTTKAFTAQWAAAIDPNNPPIIADLTERTADKALVGSITNNLPIEQFSDIALVWRGKVFSFADFPRGVAKTFSFSADGGSERNVMDLKAWIESGDRYAGVPTKWSPKQQERYSSFDQGTTTNPVFRFWQLMFTEAAPYTLVGQTPNASLRKLDQSWRVGIDRGEQAILLLRVATREDPSAETMTRSAESPSRLWIGELPTGNKPRPAVQGTLKQETYVRVFIPVKSAKK